MPVFRMVPTAEQAQVFAELVECGVPGMEAVRIVAPDLIQESVMEVAEQWKRDGAVRAAQVRLLGSDWRTLTDAQRIEKALKRHYNQIAYFVLTNSYAEATTVTLSKLDKGRDALEKKLAGNAGKMDPLAEMWAKALAAKAEKPVGKPGEKAH